MNCFEFRKLLLADPRRRTEEQERHIAGCPACAGLARELDDFEPRVHDALLVPVPDALAERVLLRSTVRKPGLRTWALAASLAVAIGAGTYFYRFAGMEEEQMVAAVALGPTHPAVAAIAYVVDNESQLLKEGRSGDPAVMQDALARLGMKLPAGGGVNVTYLGKCPVPVPSGSGEHIVLQTAAGQATLILVPDDPLGPRVTVADRHMTALADTKRSGGYILVADSLERIKRIEKLLM